MYEPVHALTDWYDGPRRGIAEYGGRPHRFESEWSDGEDIFLLMPLDADTLALALEDWAIWRRWETAFHLGETSLETHPALPEDRARHETLQRLLEGRLAIDPALATRATAEFRTRQDPEWSGHGWPSFEVWWSALPAGD